MLIHRVDRVPGFLSSRPNWLPRPLTRKRVLPFSPIWFQGGGTHSLLGEGGGGRGEPIWTKGQTLLAL